MRAYRILLLIVLASPLAFADCRTLFPTLLPALAEARLEKEGVEVLEVPPLEDAAVDRIFEALHTHSRSGRLLPGVRDGNVQIPEELRSNPALRPALEELTKYLDSVIAQSRQALQRLGGNHNFSSPRVDIRWNEDGLSQPGQVSRNHVDGTFATTAITLIGPATIVAAGKEDVDAPMKGPVLMIGQVGAATWHKPGAYHRTPPLDAKPRRLFIQIQF